MAGILAESTSSASFLEGSYDNFLRELFGGCWNSLESIENLRCFKDVLMETKVEIS